MYVLETKRYHDGLSPDHCLWEMTKAEFENAKLAANISKFDHRFVHVTAQEARNYVKRGGLHTTALWVDDEGKVRKAVEGY